MVKNYDNTSSRFHLIPERIGQTDGQTDRQICYINCVSMLTRDKNLSSRQVILKIRKILRYPDETENRWEKSPTC